MTVLRIKLGDQLTKFQKAWVLRKLENMDEICPIPIVVHDQTVCIYYGETEDCSVWSKLYKKLGYSAHCV